VTATAAIPTIVEMPAPAPEAGSSGGSGFVDRVSPLLAATPDGAAAPTSVAWTLRPSKISVIGAVGRRLVPYLIEATLIPTGLFYLLLATTRELRWALVGALCLSYAAVVRRLLVGSPIPGLLVLATLGISVRTTVYLFSHNSFVYFAQPILRTVLTAIVFAGSVALGRPLIARFADDFCPLSADVRCRPGILRLFRRLSCLWAAINAIAAGTTLALLLTVPVSVFVVSAALAAWLVTCTGAVVTVVASVTTARREGLITALAPNGRLYAATVHPTAK
jgi:hypothetical protein